MKNKKLLLLSAMSLLAITACGGKDGPNPGPKENPDIEVLDKGNTTVTFKEIERTAMINEKAQIYIDAMKAQEEEAAAEKSQYFFNSLDGHDTVDVSKYLSQSDSAKNRPIKIAWENAGVDGDDIKFVLCEDWKFNDVVTYDITNTDDEGSVELDNLYRAKTYYYRLENADKSVQSQVQKFETADYTRTMNLNSDSLSQTVYNCRDMGGYISSFGGVRLNQNLIFRGSELNLTQFSYSGSHSINVDDSVRKKNREITKIAVELDFRKYNAIDQTNSAGKSALDAEDFPVEYTRIAFQSYRNFVEKPDGAINKNEDKITENAIKEAMALFANADEKHVYYHCWGGADRTGAMGFFLNGLLGVSLTDLYIDFELTSQNNSLRSHLKANGDYDFPDFLNACKEDEHYAEDKSIAQFCYDWFLDQGVEAETLEHIREIMIPGYEAGMDQTF